MSNVSQVILGIDSSKTRQALENAFSIAKSAEDRNNLSSDIVNMKVTTPGEGEFSERVNDI